MESALIRKTFLDFFEKKGHQIVESAPMVMKDDPTLMFTNAGMNQFKDFFLGNRKPKDLRVTDTQKCLRVSGKHNDLEEVGVDTYHHTMFEMLGNWSFGDYFKEEAIAWACELLLDVYKLDRDRLYATYFDGDKEDGLSSDEETKGIWGKYFDEDKILGFGKKDNFWEMGETGPCGPCSEIHIDLRSDEERAAEDGAKLVNADHPQVIELWNLVFIQYNRSKDKSLKDLPKKHVDTGMGFERLVRVMQSKTSNYDTDVFMVLIKALEGRAGGIKYSFSDSKSDIAFRVVVDHLRAVSFAIAEGQLPSNTGAGYVIRRILRRAIRYAYSFLDAKSPLINELVPALVASLGPVFKELVSQTELIQKVIREEEESFLRTLDKGIERFEKYLNENAGADLIDGKFAFELYDTYGFPLDLTQLLALEKDVAHGVDVKTFNEELEAQKNRSRDAGKVETSDWVELLKDDVEEFVGYDQTETDIYISRYREVQAKSGTFFHLIFNITPFYAEGGGQVGDTGFIASADEQIRILDTKKENDVIIHVAEKLPENPQSRFKASVDVAKRIDTERNHSATHLLHHALRNVLGNHVEQKGSLVHPDYLRFDFSHFEKLNEGQLNEIERMVNEQVKQGIALDEQRAIPISEAREKGAMALFGEKYGDLVRVIQFGDSIELCGGTHVQNTAQIGQVKITSEGSISAGIRRIEAITGRAADQFVNDKLVLLDELNELLKKPVDLKQAVAKLIDENQKIRKELEKVEKAKAGEKGKELENKIKEVGAYKALIESSDMPADAIKNLVFQLKKKDDHILVALSTKSGDKLILTIGIGQKVIDDLKLSARDIISQVSSIIQGGGGGQDHFATAGGKNTSGEKEALDKISEILEQAANAT